MNLLHPGASVASSALTYSRAISVCRRARQRATLVDKLFWLRWEERHMDKMVDAADILIRFNTIQSKLRDAWNHLRENH